MFIGVELNFYCKLIVWTTVWTCTNHNSDNKVKDVPAIIPESPEPINPLKNYLKHKYGQCTVIKNL